MPIVRDEARELRVVLGARLAAARRDALLTQVQLAERIGYSRATVAGVESGHQQAAEGFWRRCDTVLHAAGELVAAWQALLSARRRRERELEQRSQGLREARAAEKQTVPDLRGPPRRSVVMEEPVPVAAALAGAWPATMAAVPELWRLDEQLGDGYRQGTEQVGEVGGFDVGGYLSPAVRWLTWSREERRDGQLEASGHRAVSLADVATVQEMTRAFGRLDDLFGGGHARDALLGYLNVEVAPMLVHGATPKRPVGHC